MNDCIFCAIAAGQESASRVYEDDLVIAFLDIQPVNRGHLLVVPRAHATCLADLPVESGAQIFRVAQHLGAALRSSGYPCEGINFFLADGEAAMQEILHVHLHVFPRFANDGFGLRFPDRYHSKPDRDELEQTAAAIRTVLGKS